VRGHVVAGSRGRGVTKSGGGRAGGRSAVGPTLTPVVVPVREERSFVRSRPSDRPGRPSDVTQRVREGHAVKVVQLETR